MFSLVNTDDYHDIWKHCSSLRICSVHFGMYLTGMT